MKHKEKYYVILSLILIIGGAAIIGFGVWYGFSVFHGNNIPSILEGKGDAAQSTVSVNNVHLGETSVGVPPVVSQSIGKLGDIVLQYLFVFLLFSGGGRMAKIGINTAKIPHETPKREKEET